MKVLLVCMPFADLGRPAMGVSLLKAELEASGVPCRVLYPTFTFAREIGLPEYDFVEERIPWRAMATEWVFARALYGSSPCNDDAYVDDVLAKASSLTRAGIQRLRDVQDQTETFLNRLVSDIAWSHHDVVGFSSFCGQNLASLALARRVKEAYPHTIIVFGGRNWEGEMGLELHRLFPFVDFACTGEADISFPALIRALRDAGSGDLSDLGGVIYRRQGRSLSAGPALEVADLDSLPVPDFDDYFEQLRANGYSQLLVPTLSMEASRGCWWAARQPCAFCGLNGVRTTYRSKSPGRVVREARLLTERYTASSLDLVDMVVSPSFLSDALPQLAADPLRVPLFVQVRATLTLDQLRLMKRAGVTLQCGIESLIDQVLNLVNKGTTSLENIRFLKWCSALGLKPVWPLLYGFPRELAGDYVTLRDLLPSLHFLEPPSELASVLVPRFSPYFSLPADYALQSLRPLPAYQHLYACPAASLERVALFFTGDDGRSSSAPAYLPALQEAVEAWRAEHSRSADLRGTTTGDGLILYDTRSVAADAEVVLDACDAAVYRACDEIATFEEIATLVSKGFPECADSLEERMTTLVERRVMLKSGDRYLGLAQLDEYAES